MIVVDSSAIIAILFKEPEVDVFAELLGQHHGSLISSIGALECAFVLAGRNPNIVRPWAPLDLLIAKSGLKVVPFDHEQVVHAREAFLRFGKGRHPAGLNMGDCAAYALARSRGLPLLYKGTDFARTDVEAAAPD